MSAAVAIKRTRIDNFTYADYVTWEDEPRFELIDGEAFEMSAPTITHQAISTAFIIQFGTFLRGKTCRVLHAPCDVRLNHDRFDNTVVQPDILVVCDRSKLDGDKAVLGAPDLVIEILSENTRRHDLVMKFNAYLKAGVREYWVVDPEIQGVSVHLLENGKYYTQQYEPPDTINVHVLDGLTINLAEIFENTIQEQENENA